MLVSREVSLCVLPVTLRPFYLLENKVLKIIFLLKMICHCNRNKKNEIYGQKVY